MRPDEIRPTYDVGFDEVELTWCVYRTEFEDMVPDCLVAEFEDEATAIGVCDCMNDVMQRLWYEV